MSPEDLVGFAEVVGTLKVPRRTAARYVKRADFPAPFVRLASGPIWLRRDIQKWAKGHLPLAGGRPRKSPGT